MNELIEQLRAPFCEDQEYRASYAESFMNSFVAAQIKVLREQRDLSQQELADLVGTKQAGISRLENINYTAWKVETLTRLARAFDVRLKITFEEFGTLPDDVDSFGRRSLERVAFKDDPVFTSSLTLNESLPLTENEMNALSPSRAKVLPFEKKKSVVEPTGEEVYARNVDSPSTSTSVHGTGRTESRREGVPAGPSEGIDRKISVPQQQQYRQG
jgi:transcriptional regulator with XRE-family HTH domain